jgi:D-sedoheptulose 7-phosphate isomerase
MNPQVSSESKIIASAHLTELTDSLAQIDVHAIDRVFEHLRRARDAGATIFVAGNGGSAATASHWANDLGKTAKRSGQAPIRVMSLSDNASWVTALANDEGYDRVFAGQLENFLRPEDILVVISASGSSPNLVQAVELAQSRQATTIGFLGFDGGILKPMVNELIWIPTERGAYELVEDCHMALCHILTKCLARDTKIES